MDKPLHFMLRYSDKITRVDTIKEHLNVVKTRHTAWMGKFGVGCSSKVIDIANDQIKSGIPLYIYLVNGCNFTFRADVIAVVGFSGEGGRCPDPSLVPAYYKNNKCKVWFHVKNFEKPEQNEIRALRLYKSPLSAPQMSGMRGLIYLTDDTFEINFKNSNKPKNSNNLLVSSCTPTPEELEEIERENERVKLFTCSLFD